MDRFVALLMPSGFPAPEVLARALGRGSPPPGILRVLWPRGFVGGFAFETVLLLCAAALAAAGGGRWSLGRGKFSRS